MEASKNQLNFRDKLYAALALGGIAVAALVGVDSATNLQDEARDVYDAAHMTLEGDSGRPAGPGYSQEDLARLPKKKVIVKPGEGILHVIQRTNKGADIFSNGPALNAEYEYIKDRAPGGVLQRYQKMKVPIIPLESK